MEKRLGRSEVLQRAVQEKQKGGMKTGIVWFRNNIRVHDNEALLRAASECDKVCALFCFDPEVIKDTQHGFKRIGPRRFQFLIESLDDLHHSLAGFGNRLHIELDCSELAVPRLCSELGADRIFVQAAFTTEEIDEVIKVKDSLPNGVNLEICSGPTLYDKNDLPFAISALPDVFTNFRKQVERHSPIKAPTVLEQLPPAPAGLPEQDDPTEALKSLMQNLPTPRKDPRAAIDFKGGASESIKRLNHYFWESKSLQDYKQTRNGLIGADYSSKFSAWLANGSLSPRKVHSEVARYERDIKKNSSTYWLIFELLWRDYFHFVALKYGAQLFQSGGIRALAPIVKSNPAIIEAWTEGQTGIPFIDANMRELKLTGFMSNRGRQNVASFFVKDLCQDWRVGAAYFEQELVDYDPASNWGNWAYVAGVGNDPRETRYFNIMTQAQRYDPPGEYVRLWLPELADVHPKFVHKPWMLDPKELVKLGLAESVYARPILVPEQWRL